MNDLAARFGAAFGPLAIAEDLAVPVQPRPDDGVHRLAMIPYNSLAVDPGDGHVPRGPEATASWDSSGQAPVRSS